MGSCGAHVQRGTDIRSARHDEAVVQLQTIQVEQRVVRPLLVLQVSDHQDDLALLASEGRGCAVESATQNCRFLEVTE